VENLTLDNPARVMDNVIECLFYIFSPGVKVTRLIYIPDDHSLIILETAVSADELVAAVNNGSWTPPETPGGCMPPGSENPLPSPLHALRLGQVVAVLPEKSLRIDWTEPAAGCAQPEPLRAPLTPRQRQVLQLLAEGLDTKEIARRLGITKRTVSFHISTLKEQFGVNTRAGSVSRGKNLGLVR
jgi:DNA-binding CsgD family transcriptional regulator